MITIERTDDMELVRKIMTHPRIYPHVTDDFAPSPDEFRPNRYEWMIYLAACLNGTPEGIFIFIWENGISAKVHHCLLPAMWGGRALLAANLAMEWMFTNTRCLRITGKTPSYNKLALRFADRMGMETIGIDRNSVMKNGKLYDQIITGISKENHNGN